MLPGLVGKGWASRTSLVAENGDGTLTVIIGLTIMFAGVVLTLYHIHTWRIATDSTEDRHRQKLLVAQVRRRCLLSAGIATLGLILAAFEWVEGPVAVIFLMTASLFILVMSCFVALLELISVRHLFEREKQGTQEAKRALVREYLRLKQNRDPLEDHQEDHQEEEQEDHQADRQADRQESEPAEPENRK